MLSNVPKPMPKYSYTAKSLKGENKSGTLDAKDESHLAKLLHQEGYILISAEKPGTKKKKSLLTLLRNLGTLIPFLGKVSIVEKMMFTRNLQVMVKAGLPLPRALRILGTQAKSKKLKKALSGVVDEIIKGRSFSEALSQHPNIFSEFFQNMVKVAEESGTLEDVLKILVRQMEREHELKSKVKGAMTYPLVIIIAMVGIGILMMIMVVPKLSETFEELEIDLPLMTQIVIAIGNFLAQFWYLIPLLILALIVFLKLLLSLKAGKKLMDKLFLKLPIVSPIIRKTNSAYTVRSLGSLIASGVPIVSALEIISRALSNFYFSQAMAEAAKRVRKGADLSEALKPYQDVYPSLVVQMLEVGEETGQTSDILIKLADFFEEEVSNATKNLASIIEPVLMIILGAAVGFFAVSMIQPMYSMLGTL